MFSPNRSLRLKIKIQKIRQPSGPIFGSVYNSATSVCFCKQKPSGNCLDNSIIA